MQLPHRLSPSSSVIRLICNTPSPLIYGFEILSHNLFTHWVLELTGNRLGDVMTEADKDAPTSSYPWQVILPQVCHRLEHKSVGFNLINSFTECTSSAKFKFSSGMSQCSNRHRLNVPIIIIIIINYYNYYYFRLQPVKLELNWVLTLSVRSEKLWPCRYCAYLCLFFFFNPSKGFWHL